MRTNSARFIRIQEQSIVQQLVAKTEPLIKRPNHLSLKWLTSHQWAAVPVPDSIIDEDAKFLADALEALGSADGFAVSTELAEEAVAYSIVFSQEALVNFNLEFSLSNFIITDHDLRFAIMKEAGNYFVVAGEKDFVQKAVGGSIFKARSEFDMYATDEFWPTKLKAYLVEVQERYQGFNGL